MKALLPTFALDGFVTRSHGDRIMGNAHRSAYRRALGRVIRDARKAAGLTTVDVAREWNCDRSLVSHVEAGRRGRVSVHQLDVFAHLVGSDPCALMHSLRRALLVESDEDETHA